MYLFYHTCILLMKFLLLALSRWEVDGKANAPRKGPLIIVANHLSMIDPLVLCASVPRRIAFMAKEELFHPALLGFFTRTFGSFPVRRGQPDREALRQAQEVLQRGVALGMFPEGTRSRTGQLKEAHPGTSLIALRSGAPILPVAIVGTEGVNSIRGIFSRPHIRVKIGEPFYLPPINDRLTGAHLTELTGFIMEHIAGLLPVSYRGGYHGAGDGD